MPIIIDQIRQFTPEKTLVIGSTSPLQRCAVVFEDDGEAGYFYACQSLNDENIYDAVHIYNASNLRDNNRISEIKIGWSSSGWQALLLINQYAHAVFDFEKKRGWCRTGFPEANKQWSLHGHKWDDVCLDYFKTDKT